MFGAEMGSFCDFSCLDDEGRRVFEVWVNRRLSGRRLAAVCVLLVDIVHPFTRGAMALVCGEVVGILSTSPRPAPGQLTASQNNEDTCSNYIVDAKCTKTYYSTQRCHTGQMRIETCLLVRIYFGRFYTRLIFVTRRYCAWEAFPSTGVSQ